MAPVVVEIGRHDVPSADLVASFPARLSHPHKRLLYDLACPRGSTHAGTITVSRWRAGSLEDLNPSTTTLVEGRPGFFPYDPPRRDDPTMHWHVNFADPHLFAAYRGPLLAQDELQVAEHPALASVTEAMNAGAWGPGLAPLTVEGDDPTPVLVRGVERRCRIATGPDAAAGRPEGLYGNRFAAAPADTVRRAVTRLDPPTITNLLAMAAPRPGSGSYRAEEITQVLRTAVAGFAAARQEANGKVTIHTGFWGCGAFGGNRVLMTALQVVAARLTGVERLVYWTGANPADAEAFAGGCDFAERLPARTPSATDIVDRAVAAGYRWGVSDGN